MVMADDANEAFPDLVVEYLESNFDLLRDDVLPTTKGLNSNFKLTRALEQWAIENEVSFDPKVIIVRNLDLDKQILNRASAAPITNRRATVAAKKVSSIPFGVRGRKRKMNNIAYVGLQPNPDGRILTQAPNNAPSTSSGFTASQRRTYARSKSVSMQSAPTVQAPENPPPSQAIDVSTAIDDQNDTTYDFNSFDSTSMGRLNYSSDSD